MQLGHVPLALAVATYDWNPKTVTLCLGMHFLPNLDAVVERAGLAEPGFHCTVTHTVWFAVVMSCLVGIVSPHYAIFTFAAIMTHFVADIGSTVGLPLLWPFHKKKFTLALFQDSGSWGREMYTGYYRQPMSWVLEGGVVAFFVWRLYQIGAIGSV